MNDDSYKGGLVQQVRRFRAFVRTHTGVWDCVATSDDKRTAETYAHDLHGRNAKVRVLPFPETPDSNEQRSE